LLFFHSWEATHTNTILFGLTRSWLQPTIYRDRDEHANHYTTDTILRFWYDRKCNMTTTTKLEALMFQKRYIMWSIYFSTNIFFFFVLILRFSWCFMWYLISVLPFPRNKWVKMSQDPKVWIIIWSTILIEVLFPVDFYEKKVKQRMVNNSTMINKTKNHLSPLYINTLTTTYDVGHCATRFGIAFKVF
jgi:hypothetical protein